MKSSFVHSSLIALAIAASAGALPTMARAQNLTYHVDINVAALLTAPTQGPYSLDFQLNGDGLPAAATNSVSLSNFQFSTGAAVGSPTTYQGASGNLSSGVLLSLNSSNTLNEIYQQFSATTTDIQFNVTSTENSSGITPDLFSVSILDNTLAQIPTTAPDGLSLLTETINGSVPAPIVQTYRSTSPAGVTVSAVPEPATTSAVLAGLIGLALARGRKKI